MTDHIKKASITVGDIMIPTKAMPSNKPVEDLGRLTKKELEELLKRQQSLMKMGRLVQSLPDKGAKIKESITKIQKALKAATTKETNASFLKSVNLIQEFEWKMTTSDRPSQSKVPAAADESEEEELGDGISDSSTISLSRALSEIMKVNNAIAKEKSTKVETVNDKARRMLEDKDVTGFLAPSSVFLSSIFSTSAKDEEATTLQVLTLEESINAQTKPKELWKHTASDRKKESLPIGSWTSKPKSTDVDKAHSFLTGASKVKETQMKGSQFKTYRSKGHGTLAEFAEDDDTGDDDDEEDRITEESESEEEAPGLDT